MNFNDLIVETSKSIKLRDDLKVSESSAPLMQALSLYNNLGKRLDSVDTVCNAFLYSASDLIDTSFYDTKTLLSDASDMMVSTDTEAADALMKMLRQYGAYDDVRNDYSLKLTSSNGVFYGLYYIPDGVVYYDDYMKTTRRCLIHSSVTQQITCDTVVLTDDGYGNDYKINQVILSMDSVSLPTQSSFNTIRDSVITWYRLTFGQLPLDSATILGMVDDILNDTRETILPSGYSGTVLNYVQHMCDNMYKRVSISLTNLIHDQLVNASILSAGREIAHDLLQTNFNLSATLIKVNSLMDTNLDECRTFINNFSNAYNAGGILTAIRWLIAFFSTKNATINEDGELVFTDNKNYKTSIYTAGILSSAINVLSVLAVVISTIISPAIGVIAAGLSSVVTAIPKMVSYDYEHNTIASYEYSATCDCYPYAIYQGYFNDHDLYEKINELGGVYSDDWGFATLLVSITNETDKCKAEIHIRPIFKRPIYLNSLLATARSDGTRRVNFPIIGTNAHPTGVGFNLTNEGDLQAVVNALVGDLDTQSNILRPTDFEALSNTEIDKCLQDSLAFSYCYLVLLTIALQGPVNSFLGDNRFLYFGWSNGTLTPSYNYDNSAIAASFLRVYLYFNQSYGYGVPISYEDAQRNGIWKRFSDDIVNNRGGAQLFDLRALSLCGGLYYIQPTDSSYKEIEPYLAPGDSSVWPTAFEWYTSNLNIYGFFTSQRHSSSSLYIYENFMPMLNMNGFTVCPPLYDGTTFILSVFATITTAIAITVATAVVAVKASKAIKRAQARRAAQTEHDWSNAVKDPSDENITAYMKSVRKNNTFASITGGTKYSKTGFWTTAQSDSSILALNDMQSYGLTNKISALQQGLPVDQSANIQGIVDTNNQILNEVDSSSRTILENLNKLKTILIG